MAAPIALHHERTDDPRTLSWRVRHTLDPEPGLPLPEALERLVSSGVLAGATLALDQIDTTLAPERSWRTDGAAVRAAVQAAVRAQEQRLDDASPAERDAALARIAREVAAAVVAPIATAHGGQLEVVRAEDAVVVVRLTGACHGCPASATTLHQRLEHELRQRLPWVRGVQVAEDHRHDRPARRV
ncbi:MAG: NifU family protein [Kineosporiaceae bacterium]